MYKPQVFGKYLLLDKISHGGMGEVYKAKSFGLQGFEKLFAIKRILPKLSQTKTFIDMLVDEAKIIVSLNHSNIAQVYEFNRIADTYYLAMEFIHGRDLRAIIEKVDSFPYEIACYLVAELARGLHYLHNVSDSNGKKLSIIHRDISPRNVIVSFEGEVKIIDFGIANASNRAFPIGNDIFVGKYAYMSPEQLLGKPLTHKSDIFSAGIVLYELLFKQLPLGKVKDKNLLELDKDISDIDPKLDKKLLKTLPEELYKILLKATAIDPNDRYDNALALYKDTMGFIVNSNQRIDSFLVSQYIKNLFSSEIYGHTKDNASEDKTFIMGLEPTPFAERKKVAVIHIDIESLSLEDNHREQILTLFKEILGIVQKNGGVIYRLQDRELVALFGLPQNREDDVYRAISATLQVKEYIQSLAQDPHIELKMALDFGSVVVSFKDEDLKSFTISDGPEQRVKNLITYTSDREILLGGAVKQMAMDQFEIKEIEKNGNKVFSLIDTRKKQKSYTSVSELQQTFIGRETEGALCEKAFSEITLKTGKNIIITGEAGIGKTAFIREIARKASVLNIQTFIQVFHPSIKTPYGIFKELIVQLLSIDTTDPESISLKIGELEGFGLTKTELDAIKSILSLRYKSEALESLSPVQQKLVICVALRKIVLGIANQKTLLVFEDLNFADELSLEAIDMLLAEGALPQIVMIKTYRSNFSYAWKNKDPLEVIIPLTPFSQNTLRDYAQIFTSDIPLADSTLSKIFTKSSGNPLFAGEIIKSLLDTKKLSIVDNKYSLIEGSTSVVIPDTIYSLLAARVDALDKHLKTVLRQISVIGQEFSFDELKMLSDNNPKLEDNLSELQSLGIISKKEESHERMYHITTVLMHEIIYKSLTAHYKEEMHKRCAEYLSEKYKDGEEEHINILAYHYSKSNDALKAFDYLIKAGDCAYKVYLLSEANRYYIEAIACFLNHQNLLKDRYLKLIELNYKVGIINQIMGKLDVSMTSFNESLALSQSHNIQDFVPKTYHQIARINNIQGNYDKALHFIQEAMSLSSKANNQKETVEFLHAQAAIYRLMNNHTKALELFEQGLQQAEAIHDPHLESMYLNSLGISYQNQGEHTKALECYKKTLALRKEQKNKLAIAVVLTNISAACYKIAKFDKAIEYAKKSLRLSSEIEDKLGICFSLNNLGEVYLIQHDFETAASFFHKGLESSREISWKEGIASSTLHLALIMAHKNEDLAGAKDLLQETEERVRELNHIELIAKTYLAKSKILLSEGQEEESQAYLNKAHEIITENNLTSDFQVFKQIISNENSDNT